jgi:uncharacterized membrane protein YeiH
MPPWLEHFAVAVCAISGVLAAAGRGVDLFGVLVLALVTAVGGGTIRDVCLGAEPVFWIQNPSVTVTALLTALATFVVARFWKMPLRALLVADAVGLAMFTIVGAEKSLQYQESGIIAVILGVITGVAGGIIRDVLCRELPLVFRQETFLYATAATIGSVAYVLLYRFAPAVPMPGLVGMIVILLLRLAAIVWRWRLPVFDART